MPYIPRQMTQENRAPKKKVSAPAETSQETPQQKPKRAFAPSAAEMVAERTVLQRVAQMLETVSGGTRLKWIAALVTKRIAEIDKEVG